MTYSPCRMGVVLGLVLFVAAGCGSGSGGEDEITQEARRIATLDDRQLRVEAEAAASRLWEALLEHSGLDEDLGRDAARRISREWFSSFTIQPLETLPTGFERPASAAGIHAYAQPGRMAWIGAHPALLATRPAETHFRVQWIRSAQAEPTAAGAAANDGSASSIAGLFLGVMELGLLGTGLVKMTNDGSAGRETRDDFTVTVDRSGVAVEIGHDAVIEGVTLKARNSMAIQVCPEADGSFESTARLDMTMTRGSVGGRAEIDIKLGGRLDDDANAGSTDEEYRIQMADHEGGKGSFIDFTVNVNWPASDSKDQASVVSSKYNRASSDISKELAATYLRLGMTFARFISQEMLQAAREGWESGRCVRLEPRTEPAARSGLVPSATATIFAEPRSLLDGTPTRGSVLARLKGATSVAPANTKTTADATFAYVAPPEIERKATVALEARSRRGIGRAEVVFDTYRPRLEPISNWGHFKLRGVICDTEKPFEFDAIADGNEVTIAFTPVDATSGSIRLGGNVEGAVIKGTGSYTLRREGDGGHLTMKTTGTGTMGPMTVPAFVATETIALGSSYLACRE